ncbi:hypothetical protein FIV42_24005 [Persicimonas caeni]|uniref:YokE-like PH domain-containing protein n=1 Tax=Persicimonas caeni TaxID=2292766 RepID=A0A4Y6Q136_PERCE|nr:PH domain-containing protein [Persicimonas caeni]QDG53695.1 hypothetical protein FIV42_24005 [Persicimonas caeni]QED34916.1 hypothetical protein FRD00_24000 [Persicimonas caeni]
MEWYLIAFLALFIAAAIAFWLVRQRNSRTDSIRLDRLETRLAELGVEPGGDATPPFELLRLHVRDGDSILAATRARHASKKAILVLLDDRLVYVAATMGRTGAEAQTIPYDHITDLESEPHVGGNLRLETTRGPITFTHIPLSHFANIVNTLNDRLRRVPPSGRPLQPARGT